MRRTKHSFYLVDDFYVMDDYGNLVCLSDDGFAASFVFWSQKHE